MHVTVILEATAKDGRVDELIEMFRQNFKQTRVYDGCISVAMSQNQDDPNGLIIVMDWESRKKYETYLQWRADTGAVAMLSELAGENFSISYFNRLDA